MGRELSRLDIVLETGTDLLSKVPDDLLVRFLTFSKYLVAMLLILN